MKKGIILLADGFEPTEALGTQDVLLRAGMIVDLVSINGTNHVVSSMGTKICVQLKLELIDVSMYDFVIIPGGTKGVENLINSREVATALKHFYENDKLICAICAGPSLLITLGMLDNRKFTCFPGFEMDATTRDDKNPVVVDHNLITARSMYYSIAFAEEIIKFYLGQKGLDKIRFGTRGIKN
ncbi:MAG: DJ-1 family glyoxalase III [Bacilli bacterium]